jgi:adenosylcobinamide-phosphate synthase
MLEGFFAFHFPFWLDSILIFVLAFLIDIVFGEYPDRIHPTIGIGKIISYLRPKLKNKNPKVEKANGVLLVVGVVAIVSLPVLALLFGIRMFLGSILYIIVGAILFKATFAIRGMGQYTRPIAKALKKKDLAEARKWMPYIVRRDPNSCNERQIISAAVESIAESTTDGITSPFFFFMLLGVPGAFAYRVVNTLDSMVAYKTPELRNIGWFTAKMDSLTNYIPTRLTAVLMVAAAGLVGKNWRESIRILRRDKGKTTSVNAGWTISAMAGALDVQLEKQGCYSLGDDHGISAENIFEALRVMEVTAVLFGVIVVLPLLTVRVFVVQNLVALFKL